MTGLSSRSVSQLLAKWKGGDQEALRQLVPLVYAERRRLAHHYLSGRKSLSHARKRRACLCFETALAGRILRIS
jgi:hypothetical protein